MSCDTCNGSCSSCGDTQEVDRLAEMFVLRDNFMQALKRKIPDSSPEAWPLDLTDKNSQKKCKDLALRGVEEIFEATAHFKNAKSHRVTEIKDFDREQFLEEMVDAFNYFLSLLIFCGFTSEDLYQAYVKKDKIIHERLKNGY